MSGFDPRGASLYHRMFCEESQKQAAQSGITIEVGPRTREGALASTWRVQRPMNGATVETVFEFMQWDDIVRRHWHAGLARLYLLAVKTYWHGTITTGLLRRVARLGKWALVTGVAPAVVLFVMPLLALWAGWIGYSLGRGTFGQAAGPSALTGLVGFAVVAGFARWVEQKLSLVWLLRTYAFVLAYGRGQAPELDDRLNRFAERIASYIPASDDDEIVVVGHSVGANLAVSTLARARAINARLYCDYKPAALLTLGGSIPMLGLIPSAQTFRSELAQLAAARELVWVDVSAPQDVASFALLNPVTASGVGVDDGGPPRPHVLSARFNELLFPATYKRATWDLFRMHFQYLMASEQEGVHDYLSVTTDDVTFRERFSEAPQTAGRGK